MSIVQHYILIYNRNLLKYLIISCDVIIYVSYIINPHSHSKIGSFYDATHSFYVIIDSAEAMAETEDQK